MINLFHAHTYKRKAKNGDSCHLCNKVFKTGETIRDHRSTLNIEGQLMCWNGEACARRANIAQYLAANLPPDEEAQAVAMNKYAPLVGLTYPDAQGRTVTVLDVDEWGNALMERGGEYWGCKAEYLEDIEAEMEAAQ